MVDVSKKFPSPNFPLVDDKRKISMVWWAPLNELTRLAVALQGVTIDLQDQIDDTPDVDGSGAFGTWTINISGNAATATLATNATNATNATTATTTTGNAGTVTNGVYTTGSYANPSWITSLAYAKLTGAPTLASGTYTATFTNVANLDSTPSSTVCQYMRVGSTVTVSGTVTVDPTITATTTQVGISLPVASVLASTIQVAGAANAPGIAGQSAAIIGDVANARAEMKWKASDITSQIMYFTFTYTVI